MEENSEKLINLRSMINGIEKKNKEFEKFVSNLNIYNRINLIKEILSSIIKSNPLLNEMQINNQKICLAKDEKDNTLANDFIEEAILKIKNNPTKKIIFLRDFLDNFEEITQNDKNIILKSIEDKDLDDLKEEMTNFVRIFKIKD